MDFESFVLAASTADLDEEPRARDDAEAVEFRMDLADSPLAALDAYEGVLPLIVTNRPHWEGGETVDDADRIEALCRAVEDESVGAVDVELDAVLDGDGQRVVDHARDHGVTAIVSAHDFETSHGRDWIRRVLMRAGDVGDVAKVAVTAASRMDVLDLLVVTNERTNDGELVATMAMGEVGRHSRAVTPLYGSKIGYAPVDPARATAPGQYDLPTLRSLVDQLRSP